MANTRLDFSFGNNSLLEFAKGQRLSSSVALQFWKPKCDSNQFCSLSSLWSNEQDISSRNTDMRVCIERGYLVELMGEGLSVCMRWIISEYIHYLEKTPQSYSFPRIIYIDTCASLSIVKWNDYFRQYNLINNHPEWIQQFWNEYFYYYRIVDAYELVALFKSLNAFEPLSNNKNKWIIVVDNFTYLLEPLECRGNLLYLLLYECYQWTKLYNTTTFLLTNMSCSYYHREIERYSSFLDIRLWIPEECSQYHTPKVKIIKSPYAST